jgi:hypothetical protein
MRYKASFNSSSRHQVCRDSGIKQCLAPLSFEFAEFRNYWCPVNMLKFLSKVIHERNDNSIMDFSKGGLMDENATASPTL